MPATSFRSSSVRQAERPGCLPLRTFKARQEVFPAFERLGNARSNAITQGKIADILLACGQLDEALRIRQEEQLPIFERLGDVRAKAATQGQIADILEARDQLDEALRIRQDEELPVYERLGDVRAKAAVLFKIARVQLAREAYPEAMDGLVRPMPSWTGCKMHRA